MEDTILMDEQIRAIRERVANATPGPWIYFAGSRSVVVQADFAQSVATVSAGDRRFVSNEARAAHQSGNGEFIAHARTDVALLLSTLDAAQARADEVRAELIGVDDGTVSTRELARRMRSRAYAAEAKVADLSRQLDALRAEKLEASAAGLRRLLADSQAKVADLEARAARYENAQCVTCGLREAP